MGKEPLIELLASALHSTDLQLSSVDFPMCFHQASAHGVANMLYFSLKNIPEKLRPDAKMQKMLKELAYGGITRDAIQDREMEELQEHFEGRKLLMLPVKGYVIKHLYPEAGMRFMSDTDILIRKDQSDSVRKVFEELGYQSGGSDEKGITDFYISPAGMHYEVHKNLEPEGARPEDRAFLKQLLSFGIPVDGKQYILRLPEEEHYVYLLCHFIKHFLGKGIGVRQVMDIYLCRKKWKLDENRLNDLLDTLNLHTFAIHLEHLADFWFETGKPDDVTLRMGAYIFSSGVFGKIENWVPNHMLKVREQKKNYTVERLFPSYDSMCSYYPSLRKFPVLLPVCWCRRIFHAVFYRRKDLAAELSAAKKTDRKVLRQQALFYQDCGLNVFEEYKKG